MKELPPILSLLCGRSFNISDGSIVKSNNMNAMNAPTKKEKIPWEN